MTPPGGGDLAWKVARLEEERPDNKRAVDLADKHEVELHGERGVYAALKTLDDRLGQIQVALWVLVAAVIGAAVVIALAVH